MEFSRRMAAVVILLIFLLSFWVTVQPAPTKQHGKRSSSSRRPKGKVGHPKKLPDSPPPPKRKGGRPMKEVTTTTDDEGCTHMSFLPKGGCLYDTQCIAHCHNLRFSQRVRPGIKCWLKFKECIDDRCFCVICPKEPQPPQAPESLCSTPPSDLPGSDGVHGFLPGGWNRGWNEGWNQGWNRKGRGGDL